MRGRACPLRAPCAPGFDIINCVHYPGQSSITAFYPLRPVIGIVGLAIVLRLTGRIERDLRAAAAAAPRSRSHADRPMAQSDVVTAALTTFMPDNNHSPAFSRLLTVNIAQLELIFTNVSIFQCWDFKERLSVSFFRYQCCI